MSAPVPRSPDGNAPAVARFSCIVCCREYDAGEIRVDQTAFSSRDQRVDRVIVLACGTCADCVAYLDGLDAGVRDLGRWADRTAATAGPGSGPAGGSVVAELSSPIGPLLVEAGESGIARVAFDDHPDVDQLRARVGADLEAASAPAREHLAVAVAEMTRYFDGDAHTPTCTPDPERRKIVDLLAPARDIPFGQNVSYAKLLEHTDAFTLAYAAGVNPIPIFYPCHRILCGATEPPVFVGGPERREWLLAHERKHALR